MLFPEGSHKEREGKSPWLSVISSGLEDSTTQRHFGQPVQLVTLRSLLPPADELL